MKILYDKEHGIVDVHVERDRAYPYVTKRGRKSWNLGSPMETHERLDIEKFLEKINDFFNESGLDYVIEPTGDRER